MAEAPGDGFRIRVRPTDRGSPDAALDDPGATAAEPELTVHTRARDRVREALVCPYCRDQVARDDVVACAAKACGALYHRECWEHCRTEFGSCAALGCGSTTHRELGSVGYLYRLLRLFVAAILFPPRALKAWRELPRDSSAYREAHRRAKERLDRFLDHPVIGGFVFLLLAVLSYSAAAGILYGIYRLEGAKVFSDNPGLIFGVFFFSPLLVPLLSYALTFQLVLGVHLARAALAGEFAALDRAERGGLSYLARIAASVGKGKPPA